MIRDAKPLSADTLASLYGTRVPNLVRHNFWTKTNLLLFIISVFNNLTFPCRLEAEGISVYSLNVHDCSEQ